LETGSQYSIENVIVRGRKQKAQPPGGHNFPKKAMIGRPLDWGREIDSKKEKEKKPKDHRQPKNPRKRERGGEKLNVLRGGLMDEKKQKK